MNEMRFLDVSADPESRERAQDTLGAADSLRAAGFETVGYVEDRISERSLVHEVMRSPDSTALAMPEDHFGQPFVVLRTLLDDGTMVETGSRPRGHRRLVPHTRVMHRAAGVEVRLVGADADAVWPAHRRHVEDVRRKRGSPVGPHEDIALYSAMGERATKVMRVRMTATFAALVLVLLVVALVNADLFFDMPAWVFFGSMYAVMWVNPGRWIPLRRIPRDELLRATAGPGRG